MADFITAAETISVARRGMTSGECQIDARVADAALPAGVLVSKGTGDNTCKVPAAAADVTQGRLGISTYLAMREPAASGVVEYAAADLVNFVKDGEVYVIVESSGCTAGLQPFARITASGGNTQLGAFRADADTATATAVPNATFKDTLAGAGVARVGVKFP